MNKLLIICGPTATGKTALGIKLARKFGGEIVSVDSRQIYKGMDVGIGKDLPANSKLKTQNSKLQIKTKNYLVGYRLSDNIPIWLVDICQPSQEFSVAHWVKFAELVVEDIWQRKKLPIVVGGTGFWIKALIEGVDTIGVPPDWKLRKKLGNLEVEKLREILERIYPERLRGMNESDRKNPRRLIRAIEIARANKYRENRKVKDRKTSQKQAIAENCEVILIGLKEENKMLYERIDRRVEERIGAGVEKEIKCLLKRGHTFENSVLGTTIGYKEWQPYFEKLKPKKEVIQRWKFNEYAYARRQMTWFKKNKNINWFKITKPAWQKDVVKLVKNWYSEI